MMSIQYVPSSMKSTDKDHLQFAIVNRVDSGSASIGAKLLVEGADFTEKATLQIENQRPQNLGPSIYISTRYGDKFLVSIDHEGKIKPGRHKVKITVDTPVGSYSSEFEDAIK